MILAETLHSKGTEMYTPSSVAWSLTEAINHFNHQSRNTSEALVSKGSMSMPLYAITGAALNPAAD